MPVSREQLERDEAAEKSNDQPQPSGDVVTEVPEGDETDRGWS